MSGSFQDRVGQARARINEEARAAEAGRAAVARDAAVEAQEAAVAAKILLPEVREAVDAFYAFDIQPARQLRIWGSSTLHHNQGRWLTRMYKPKRSRFGSGFLGWEIGQGAGAVLVDASGNASVRIGSQVLTLEAAATEGMFCWTWAGNRRLDTSGGTTKILINDLFLVVIEEIAEYLARH